MLMQDKTISVIVPVFNEEKTVAKVAQALIAYDDISGVSPAIKSKSAIELIFVNDGSMDKSKEILESFNNQIKLINLERNYGKGFALAVGVKKATGGIVIFLDADLLNLKPEHVDRLALPLLINQADVVLAKISSTTGLFDPFPPFSGQRAYWRKDLLPHLKQIAKTRYGVEVYLNNAFKKKKTKTVKLKDISYLLKRQKMDLSLLPSVYLKQALEISKTIARVNGMSLKKVKSVFDDKKIKSIKNLLITVDQSQDIKDLKGVRKYIMSHLPKYFKFKDKNE